MAVKTTPGNVSDGALQPGLIDAHPQETTGDKAYDSKANQGYLAARGMIPVLCAAAGLEDLVKPGGRVSRSKECFPRVNNTMV